MFYYFSSYSPNVEQALNQSGHTVFTGPISKYSPGTLKMGIKTAKPLEPKLFTLWKLSIPTPGDFTWFDTDAIPKHEDREIVAPETILLRLRIHMTGMK